MYLQTGISFSKSVIPVNVLLFIFYVKMNN